MTAYPLCEKEVVTTRRRKQQGADIDDRDDHRTPPLRRLGFSTEISVSSLALNGENSPILFVQRIFALLRINTSPSGTRKIELSTNQKATCERALSPNISSSRLQNIVKTVVAQARGMTEEFNNSGLPWTGHECRSVIAGGSGVLYCLPAFFCKNNHIEQCVWFTQALISVTADYVYVGRNSWIHGIDRFFATANTLAVIFRAIFGLKIITVTLAIIPISCFILANRSKHQLDLQGWIFYHFLWHLTGSVIVAFTVYLLRTCPDYNEDHSTSYSLLNHVCSNAS